MEKFDFIISIEEKVKAEINYKLSLLEEQAEEAEQFIDDIKADLVDNNFVEIVNEADSYYGMFEERVYDTEYEIDTFFPTASKLVEAMNSVDSVFNGEDYFYINAYGGIVGIDGLYIEDHYRDNFSISDLIEYLEDENLHFCIDLTDLNEAKENLQEIQDQIEELKYRLKAFEEIEEHFNEDLSDTIEQLKEAGIIDSKILDILNEEYKDLITNFPVLKQVFYNIIYGE